MPVVVAKMREDGRQTGELDNPAGLAADKAIALLQDPELFQFLEAFAEQAGTRGVVGVLQDLDKLPPIDALEIPVLADADQERQELAQFGSQDGIFDEQRQLGCSFGCHAVIKRFRSHVRILLRKKTIYFGLP